MYLLFTFWISKPKIKTKQNKMVDFVFVCMCMRRQKWNKSLVFFMSASKYYLSTFQKRTHYFIILIVMKRFFLVLVMCFIFSSSYMWLEFQIIFEFELVYYADGELRHGVKMPCLKSGLLHHELVALGHFTFLCAPFDWSCEWRC